MRSIYRLLSLFNDVNAVRRGRVPQRIARKAAYRHFGKSMNRWLK